MAKEKHPLAVAVGKRLQAAMIEHGIDSSDAAQTLADWLKVERMTAYRYFSGTTPIPIVRLEVAARRLGKPIFEFFTDLPVIYLKEKYPGGEGVVVAYLAYGREV